MSSVPLRLGGIQSIRGIKPGDWFSPLEPISSSAPADLSPRGYEYTPGQNAIFTPRGESVIDFPTLRALADSYDLLRAVIETWKDLITAQAYEFRLKPQPGETGKQRRQREVKDDSIQRVTEFFEAPDGEHAWKQWLGALLEDCGVIDAANVWIERENGKVVRLRPLDGATITRYIDNGAFTPRPPNQAYAQVLYGQPAIPLTASLPGSDQVGDLAYLVRNWRTNRLYGYSPVEQAIVSINIALRRQMFTLNYYTEGNVPEAFYTMPPGVSVDQVKEFSDWFESVMNGNLKRRRRVMFMPGDEKGSQKLTLTKEPLLKNEMDDYLASFFCFLFGVSRQALIKQMNRASAEESGDASKEEGLRPSLIWVRDSVNRLLRAMGCGGLEISWQEARETDILKQAQAETAIVGKIVRINELREDRGLDPDPAPEANMLGTFTPTGFVPLGETSNPQQDPEDDGPAGKKPEKKPEPDKKADKAHNEPGGLNKSFPALQLNAIKIQAHDNAESAIAQSTYLQACEGWLSEQGKAAGSRVRAYVGARKVRKDDDSDTSVLIGELTTIAFEGIAWYELISQIEKPLVDAAESGVTIGLQQVQVTDNVAIGRSQKLARAWAEDRAAEMVGMKWVDGELVANPNAEYAITESTRNEIRASIEKAFADETPMRDLGDWVQKSGAFSRARAELISKTEVQNAQAAGNLDAWLATNVVETAAWLLSADHHCCDDCDLNAEAGPVKVGQAFPSGHKRPGAHPNCNCVLAAVKIKGVA